MDQFSAALDRLLSRVIPEYQSLLSCEQLTAGASQETYKICLATGSGELNLALRRAQPAMAEDSSIGSISLSTEAKLFQMASNAGIPGPAVVHVLVPDDDLGSGFLMQWLDGETLGHRIVHGEEFAAVRPGLAHACGVILGRIHQLDWQAVELDVDIPCADPAAVVEETWSRYRDLNVPVPMIDYCWRWLRENLPQQARRALVHGDFRNGNLMVGKQGINAVLDWELAHIGDPVRDLGWLCVNSWRFGARELPVGGFGSREDLLAGYAESSGVAVTDQELAFWEVFGSFWWSMATLQMANAWRTGETPSLERPVIGRRSSEAQMDCVNLLIPGPFTIPQQQAVSDGTRLPMPAELLTGVGEFLKGEVAASVDGHNKFLARVAANSLGIAQRELQYGAELAPREQQRLENLLDQTADLDTLRWELVNRLRSDLPLDTPGLAQHLRQTVAGQLSIDQPRYSALN